jgi:hypothetical protein
MAKNAKARLKTGAAKKASTAKKKGDAKVPLHVVVHFVRMLHDRNRAAKFIAHAKKSKATITVPRKEVKIVNDFVQEHNLQTARTRSGIDLCPGAQDPWKCPRQE